MRIVLHDYSGHPFQAQLSRELARRGHHVWHVYSADFQTPKGKLIRLPQDPEALTFVTITSGEVFQKSAFIKRRAQEEAYGRRVAEQIDRIGPDLVISSNAPLDAQVQILNAARRGRAGFVFWIQDVYSEAIDRILRRKLGAPGGLVGAWYRQVEFSMLRASDAVVAITDDFVPLLERRGVDPRTIHVIENWAPLEDIPAAPAPAPAPGRPIRFLYSGTLGYKHDPGLLLKLAKAIPKAVPCEVVVHSEGPAAAGLAAAAAQEGLANLDVRPWVPFDELPAALHAADVLVAIIEADAGVFSVPSKILTYMCAGRPLLASIPAGNLAARILVREQGGLVCAPGDEGAFLAHAERLAADGALRGRMGASARAYAEQAFDIAALGSRFDSIITQIRRAA